VLAFQDSVSLKDNPILEKLDVKRAALLEPQLPVTLIKVDAELERSTV
jgi:hypothetical protein